MEKNKYYTPRLKEFYSGFEYEVYIPEKNIWSKETFYLNQSHISVIEYVDIQDDTTSNPIRVKYLDKEDIKSLGFEQQRLPYQYKKDWYTLVERHEEHQYIIEDGRNQDQIFVGTIKNKSELKVLLKQLNIL